MDRSQELQSLLEQIQLQVKGTRDVYFQPPADIGMQYPCIVYQQDNAHTEFAGNKPYMYVKRYQITVIDEDPVSMVADSIAWLESALFDRHYTANNLHHSVFTLYF